MEQAMTIDDEQKHSCKKCRCYVALTDIEQNGVCRWCNKRLRGRFDRTMPPSDNERDRLLQLITAAGSNGILHSAVSRHALAWYGIKAAAFRTLVDEWLAEGKVQRRVRTRVAGGTRYRTPHRAAIAHHRPSRLTPQAEPCIFE